MAHEPFAELPDLVSRLDWTLDENELRIATTALEDLSDEARYHGKDWPDPTTAPRMVRRMVLAAAVRYMRNPDGYTTSRAGDETLAWNESKDGQAGSAHFAPDEIKALRKMAGSTGLLTAPMTAWGPQRHSPRDVGYVPAAEGSPFPYYGHPTEPW